MSYIHQLLKQAYMMFLALLTPCESKHLLRRQGKADNHVHSFRTYHNYSFSDSCALTPSHIPNLSQLSTGAVMYLYGSGSRPSEDWP